MQSSVRSSTRSSSGPHARAVFVSSVAAALFLSGCGPRYVVAPDSPLLILEGKGRLRVAAQDGQGLTDIGWIDAEDLEGQTVVEFDWGQQ
jgi:hypothetical protein